MVYGSNKNSNIDKLFKLINNSFPLILFKNSNHLKKSLISIENVKLFIKLNIEDINTIDKDILNISDNKAMSLNELVNNYKTITNSNSFIIYLPYSFLKFLVKVPVIKRIFLKLYGGFKIQNTKINNLHNVNIADTIEQLSSDLSPN